jgi:hypothetical protein
VDRDEINVATPQRRAKDVASDSTKPINPNFDSHLFSSWFLQVTYM